MSDEKETLSPLAEQEEVKRKSFAESLHQQHPSAPDARPRHPLSISVEEREKQIRNDEAELAEWLKEHVGEPVRNFHVEREKKRTIAAVEQQGSPHPAQPAHDERPQVADPEFEKKEAGLPSTISQR